jgi:nucleoside-diphosphate-sugar epimerase
VQADIGQARSVLGWQPRTTFETGLAKTLAWARGEFAAQPAAAASAASGGGA